MRARAGAIGFSAAMADTPAGELSGGEKARLLLGLATFAGPHLVILDEPTNHLDIDSRSALIAAINDYPGAVILVSHDRYLIEACADRLWLVADGAVAPFDGDLDDYRRRVLAERGAPGTDRRAAGQGPRRRGRRAPRLRRAAAEKRVELAPLRRRIADAEAEIAPAHRGDRAARCGAGRAGPVRARPRQGRRARQGARRRRRRARAARRTIGSPPAPPSRPRWPDR